MWQVFGENAVFCGRVGGRAEADDAFVTAAKKNPVVSHYFDEGWLRIAKQPAKEPAKQEPKQPAKE